jgi:hypothetical protein
MRCEAGETGLGHLFAGADAGAFSLSEDLSSLWASVAQLHDELRQPCPSDAGTVRATVQAAMATAVEKGERLPDVLPLVEAEAEENSWRLRHQLLDELTEDMENRLAAVTVGTADTIIVKHLSPALDDVVKRAHAVVAACPADHPQALLLANEKARRAWLELEAVTEQYGAIRRAREALVRVAGPPEKDVYGEFSQLENMATLIPGGRVRPGMPTPWPDDARGSLVWLIPMAVRWMPTSGEQDSAWEKAHPPQRQRSAAVPASL